MRTLIRPVYFVLVLTALAVALTTNQLPAQEAASRPISAGGAVTDSLPPGAAHAFILTLAADQFVYGEVDQGTVDVTVTVRNPAGGVVRQFDARRGGMEIFHFDGEASGDYRIELEPAEDATGRYALRLERVEPVATDPERRVDQLMLPFSGEDVPGGVVAVVREGRLVFARGYGMADLTHHIPFRPETRTNIGSTSKQFTAFAINLLAQRGRLSLDDDIRKHIPELPDLGATVTIRHLLTHTSGYREFLNTLALAGRRLDEGDHIDRSEVISIVQRQPELQNAPGAEWNYNNTAFALLAMVVRHSAGDEDLMISRRAVDLVGRTEHVLVIRARTARPACPPHLLHAPIAEAVVASVQSCIIVQQPLWKRRVRIPRRDGGTILPGHPEERVIRVQQVANGRVRAELPLDAIVRPQGRQQRRLRGCQPLDVLLSQA